MQIPWECGWRFRIVTPWMPARTLPTQAPWTPEPRPWEIVAFRRWRSSMAVVTPATSTGRFRSPSPRFPRMGTSCCVPTGRRSILASHCDVTYAGRSALKNGWLQNGPNDGLRFETGSGNVDVGYEGAPSCFSTSAAELVTETGEVSSGMGATEDDVNAFCAGRFQLLPASEATLRSIPDCPTPPIGGGARDASPESSGDATMVVERIPDTGSGGAPALYESGWFDAAVLGTPDPLPGPPSPPGCAIGHEVGSGASPLTATLVTLGFASLMLRRRRTLLPVSGSPIVRAARSGSSPRR